MFNSFEENMDMHYSDIDALIEDLEKLKLKVIKGETLSDPKCHPNSQILIVA